MSIDKPNTQQHTVHFNMILACDVYGTIGDGIKMPWVTLEGDLKRFKTLTDGQVMIMGRRTFESLSTFPRALPNRRTYVISSKYTDNINNMFINSLGTGGFTDPNLIFVDSVKSLRQRIIKDILDGVEIKTCWLAGGVSIWESLFNGDTQSIPVTTGFGTSEPIHHTFLFETVKEVHLSLVDTPQRGDVYYKGALYALASAKHFFGSNTWTIESQSEHSGGWHDGLQYPGYTYYHLRDKTKEV